MILSIVFTLVAYWLWKGDVGGVDASLAIPAGSLRLSEALVPGETHPSVTVGSERFTGERAASGLTGMRERAKRLAHFGLSDNLGLYLTHWQTFPGQESPVSLQGAVVRVTSTWSLHRVMARRTFVGS